MDRKPGEETGRGGRTWRRTLLVAAALVRLPLSALAGGAREARAGISGNLTVSGSLTTSTFVVPGGELTLNVSTLGVTVTAATAPPGCPVSTLLGAATVTFTCTATGAGLPAGTVIPLTFSSMVGSASGTATYNANGPYAGSGAVSAPTPIAAAPCNFVPASLTSTCTLTTTTQVVPGGTLDITVSGQAAPAQSVQITTTSTPTTLGGANGCALDTRAGGIPTAMAATADITFYCGRIPQSIPPGTSITVSIAANITGAPTIQASQNSDVPPALPAQQSIPNPTAQPVSFGGSAKSTSVGFVNPPGSAAVGQPVTFKTMSAVGPACGSIVSDRWDFGDNTPGQTTLSDSATHTYAAAGTYQVLLTVTDCAGGIATATTAITITAPPVNPPPPQGATVTYPAGWTIIAGPAGTIVTGASGPLYALQAGDAGFEIVPSAMPLQAGLGYWALFPTATAVNLPALAAQTVQVRLPAGQWMLIGNPGSSAATVSGADAVYVCRGDSGCQPAPMLMSFPPMAVLRPGQGAWAISATGGVATISSH